MDSRCSSSLLMLCLFTNVQDFETCIFDKFCFLNQRSLELPFGTHGGRLQYQSQNHGSSQACVWNPNFAFLYSFFDEFGYKRVGIECRINFPISREIMLREKNKRKCSSILVKKFIK